MGKEQHGIQLAVTNEGLSFPFVSLTILNLGKPFGLKGPEYSGTLDETVAQVRDDYRSAITLLSATETRRRDQVRPLTMSHVGNLTILQRGNERSKAIQLFTGSTLHDAWIQAVNANPVATLKLIIPFHQSLLPQPINSPLVFVVQPGHTPRELASLSENTFLSK